MKHRLTATTLLAGLLTGGAALQSHAATPKIVVGIVVDQLRTDYLEQLRPYMGDKGFNRLMSRGVYIPDVDFSHTAGDAATGTAVIYTGAWPMVNGVASEEVLDAAQRRSVPTLSAGQRARQEYSPENLRVSTLADEFSVGSGGLAKIYSVAADPQVAVIAAGHAGNAAVWADEGQAKWSVPAYYGSAPAQIANRNRTSPLSSKISSATWRPLRPASSYPSGDAWNMADFSYTFSGGSRDAFARYKAAAPFNSEVTETAIDLLKTMQGAKGGMLGVGYSLAPYAYDYDGDGRPELVDSYMRLDADLGRLLDSIDREYGTGNAVVFLASTGYAVEPDADDSRARIPSGEITLKQAESLLNSYLSATHGNGDYVTLIKDGRLYLDSGAAARKGLDIRALRMEAKDFLMRMGGVSEAFTIDDVLHSGSGRTREMALAVDAKNAPDLFLFFAPGWTVTDDNSYPAKSVKVRLATPATPAFILAPGLPPQTVDRPVEATAIAPTVASAINIRAPNAAAARPVVLRRE